jgi:hypothetical protein
MGSHPLCFYILGFFFAISIKIETNQYCSPIEQLRKKDFTKVGQMKEISY